MNISTRSLAQNQARIRARVWTIGLLFPVLVFFPIVLQAVGFRLPNQDPEGIARGNAFFGGAHRDELLMALLRPEWSGNS